MAFGASGTYYGQPALVMRVDRRWDSTGSGPSGAGSATQVGYLCIAILEVPAPVPALAVSRRQDALSNLMSLKTWGKLFAKPGVEIVGSPETGRYRVDARNEEFARWFMTPDVFAMMLPPNQDTPRQNLVIDGNYPAYEFLFCFSGRKVVVWSFTNSPQLKVHHGLDLLDSCLGNAFWLNQRIPQQAYGDPSGVDAEYADVSLQDLVSRLTR